MKRTSLKVLLSALIIVTMIPFSFVKADQTLYATIGYSTVTWEDDPTDARLQIGKVYLSISLSNYFSGTIDVNMICETARANDIVAESRMYSINGNTVNYTGVFVPETSGSFYRGETWRVQFINQKEIYLVYEYKVLKTGNANYGSVKYSPYSYKSINYALSEEGIYYGVTTDLIVLDLNEITDYLQQQNENYLPTIIDKLEDIHGALQLQGNGQYESFIYVKNTARVNASVNDTRYYPTYERTNYFGDGFTIENGKIKCNYNGYVIIASNAYFYRYSSNTSVADIYFRWIKNGTSIGGYNDSIRGGYGGTTCATTDIISVEQGDLLSFSFSTSSQPISYMETSTALIYYLSKDSNVDYTGILSNQLQTLLLINNTLQDIKTMIPNETQQENITIVNNEINNYNRTINNITNTYNNTISTDFQRLTFTDLINVDPEAENNILPAVNLYNNVFEGVINIPDIKSILIFFLLCVLIIAMVG